MIRSKTILTNWADLVSKSSESISNCNIDSSKVWLNQAFSDPDNLASGFETLILPVSNVLELNLPITGSDNGLNTNTIEALIVPSASEEATNKSVNLSLASKEDKTEPTPKDYSKMKISIRLKDTSLDMLQFLDLESIGLRCSPRLKSKKPKLDNSDLLYSLYTNLCNKGLPDETPTSFQERVLYVHEKVNTLFNSTVNIVKEIVLSIINNETYYLKNMLKQKDKSEFMKAMEHKIDIYERRNHWEICYRDEIL